MELLPGYDEWKLASPYNGRQRVAYRKPVLSPAALMELNQLLHEQALRRPVWCSQCGDGFINTGRTNGFSHCESHADFKKADI